MGFGNTLNLQKENNNQWEIKVIRKEEGRPTLNYVEQRDLRTGWIFEEDADKEKQSGASSSLLVIAKMRGDGILAKWREEREKLMDEDKIDEAQKLTPSDINITCTGDRAALKLIEFVPATHSLPLPTPLSAWEEMRQTTFNLLNNAAAGTGTVHIELLMQDNSEDNSTLSQELQPFCCSGQQYCIVKNIPDPNIHTCPICHKAVHAVCGQPNPDFENGKVGFKYSTICMSCFQNEGTRKCIPCDSKKGLATKRLDGQWWVTMGNEDPFLLSQEELMNTEKYFVAPVGSQLTSEEKKKQAAKVKHQRLREDAKN